MADPRSTQILAVLVLLLDACTNVLWRSSDSSPLWFGEDNPMLLIDAISLLRCRQFRRMCAPAMSSEDTVPLLPTVGRRHLRLSEHLFYVFGVACVVHRRPLVPQVCPASDVTVQLYSDASSRVERHA